MLLLWFSFGAGQSGGVCLRARSEAEVLLDFPQVARQVVDLLKEISRPWLTNSVFQGLVDEYVAQSGLERCAHSLMKIEPL